MKETYNQGLCIAYKNEKDNQVQSIGITTQKSHTHNPTIQIIPINTANQLQAIIYPIKKLTPIMIETKDVILNLKEPMILGKKEFTNGKYEKVQISITSKIIKLLKSYQNNLKSNQQNLLSKRSDFDNNTRRSSRYSLRNAGNDLTSYYFKQKKQIKYSSFLRTSTTNFRGDFLQRLGINGDIAKSDFEVDFLKEMISSDSHHSHNQIFASSAKQSTNSFDKVFNRVNSMSLEFTIPTTNFDNFEPNTLRLTPENGYLDVKDYFLKIFQTNIEQALNTNIITKYKQNNATKQLWNLLDTNLLIQQINLFLQDSTINQNPQLINLLQIWKIFLQNIDLQVFQKQSSQKRFDENLRKILYEENSEIHEKSLESDLQNEFKKVFFKVRLMLNQLPLQTQSGFIKHAIQFIQQPLSENSKISDKSTVHGNFKSVYKLLLFTSEGNKFLPQFFDEIFSNSLELSSSLLQEYNPDSTIEKFIEVFENELQYNKSTWVVLIDRLADFIKQKLPNLFETFLHKDNTGKLVKILKEKKQDFQTAVIIAAFRNLFSEGQIMNFLNTSKLSVTDDLLNDFSYDETLIPFFVFFIQNFEKVEGSIQNLKGKGFKSVDNFIMNYLTIGDDEIPLEERIDFEDYRIYPKNYQSYSELKDSLYFILNKKDHFGLEQTPENMAIGFCHKELQEKHPDNIFAEVLSASKAKSSKNEYQLFQLVLNEFSLQHLQSTQKQSLEGQSKHSFTENFFKLKYQLEDLESVKSPDLLNTNFFESQFMKDMFNNFPQFTKLALSKDKTEAINKFNIFVTHLLGSFMIDIKLDQTKWILKATNNLDPKEFPQVAGLPDEQENKKYMINQTIKYRGRYPFGNQLQQNAGFDITKLYKCDCGYHYFVGDCGGVMVIGKCPECGKDIGGSNYKLAERTGHEEVNQVNFENEYEQLQAGSSKVYKYDQLIDEESEEMAEEGAEKYEHDQLRDMTPYTFNFINLLTHARYLIGILYKPEEGEKLVRFLGAASSEEAANICYMRIKKCYDSCNRLNQIGDQLGFYWMAILSNKVIRKNNEPCSDQTNMGAKNCKNNQPLFGNNNGQLFGNNNNGVFGNNNGVFPNTDNQNSITSEYTINDRNKFEQTMVQYILPLLKNEKNKILDRIEKCKELSKSFNDQKKLMSNWIKKMVTLSDINKSCFQTDLKYVRAQRDLRFKNNNTKAIVEDFNIDIDKKFVEINDNNDKYPITKFCLNYSEILTNFGEILTNLVSISKFQTTNLSSFLTYEDLCKNTIQNLLDRKFFTSNSNNLIQEYINIIPEYRNQQLQEKYQKFCVSLTKIETLREKYPEVFDFRFQCHQNNVQADKFYELTSAKTARLIDFVIDDQHVESQFMPSVLSALIKFHNDSLDLYKSSSSYANNQFQLNVWDHHNLEQNSVGLDVEYLTNLIVKSSWCNPEYNCDSDIVYNYDLIENELYRLVISGKYQFKLNENSFGVKFSYLGDFGRLYNQLGLANVKYDKSSSRIVYIDRSSLSKEKIDEIKLMVGLLDSKLTVKEFADNKCRDDYLKILLRKYMSGYLGIEGDENDNEVLCLEIDEKIKQILLEIEEIMVYENLDLLDYCFKNGFVDRQIVGEIEEMRGKLKALSPGRFDLLKKSVFRIVSRQIYNSDNDNLGGMSWRNALEYTDVLEDEELLSYEIEIIPEGLCLKHTYDFVNILNLL